MITVQVYISLDNIGEEGSDRSGQKKYVRMATSAQVLHCPPSAHAARRHFGNALHSQAVRHSLKSGAGRGFPPQPRGPVVISAAGDSSRQSVEDRKVNLIILSLFC